MGILGTSRGGEMREGAIVREALAKLKANVGESVKTKRRKLVYAVKSGLGEHGSCPVLKMRSGLYRKYLLWTGPLCL